VEGELTPEIEQALALTEEEFQDKAVSYGFVVKTFEDVEEVLDKEIKRLTELKKRAAKRAETFKARLDEAMKQFKAERISTPMLTLSYRKSNPVELADDFEENFLKHVDIIAQVKEGAPSGLGLLVEYFDIKAKVSVKRIGDAIKVGAQIEGAKIVEKKNLQIK
jgi:translation initiation factor 2B subunit (eIF-2B alpha/beta/delta family)